MRHYSSTAGAMTLTGGVTAASGTITVDSVAGLPLSTPFTLVLDPDTEVEEIVTVTGVAGTTLTVTRGEDGSAGQEHSPGASVRHMVTARDLREPQQHIDATTGVHGLDAGEAVVGTTTTDAIAGDVATLSSTVSTIDSDLTALETTVAGKADTAHVHSAVDITTGTLPVTRGGTGATSAATARTSLGAAAATDLTSTTTRVTTLEGKATLIQAGTPAHTEGRQWYETDTDTLWVSDGASHRAVGPYTGCRALLQGSLSSGGTPAVVNPSAFISGDTSGDFTLAADGINCPAGLLDITVVAERSGGAVTAGRNFVDVEQASITASPSTARIPGYGEDQWAGSVQMYLASPTKLQFKGYQTTGGVVAIDIYVTITRVPAPNGW